MTVDPALQVIVTISATVGAIAAVGIYKRVSGLVGRVEKHDDTLYGVEGIREWEGLVARVAKHEAELKAKREGDNEDD